ATLYRSQAQAFHGRVEPDSGQIQVDRGQSQPFYGQVEPDSGQVEVDCSQARFQAGQPPGLRHRLFPLTEATVGRSEGEHCGRSGTLNGGGWESQWQRVGVSAAEYPTLSG